MLAALLKNILPAAVGIFFACFPFLWCRARGESPESYGLRLGVSRAGFYECAAVTFLILTTLTLVSINWPGEDLPRRVGLTRALKMASDGAGAALVEEIFFRGWLQPMLRKKFRAAAAVILTSVVFAAAHVFVAQVSFMIAVFFMGCVMCFLRERHGDIATATLFHAAGNIWAIWFVPSHFFSLTEWAEQLGLL
ncbi:MAG: CPBP family intramembrane metalloprotease [Synergistaceae bacterium]|jgi:membrane protease YdiL (CAAX protease family)|nr:CPBP family intramembrane metalloprotease [Synergistaceae bacterium]